MIVFGSAGKMSCLAETLTATEIFSGQQAAARQASSITHSPRSMIRPDSSASGMNCVGRDDAAGRMVPADQRLEADQALVGGVDQRLIEQAELLGLDADAHVLLEPEPVLGLVLHVGVEEAAGAAALALAW